MKPSEYPERVLQALNQRYFDTGQTRIEASELQQFSSVPNDGFYTALEIVKQKGYIEEGPEGQPFVSYTSSDGYHSIVTLSAKGIRRGQHLTRPWYIKTLNPVRYLYVATLEGITRAFTKHECIKRSSYGHLQTDP